MRCALLHIKVPKFCIKAANRDGEQPHRLLVKDEGDSTGQKLLMIAHALDMDSGNLYISRMLTGAQRAGHSDLCY